jgi:hypothetical protein
VSNPQPALIEPTPARLSDAIARYRLRSEGPVEGTDTWEVQWQPVPPADGPPVIRRLSREMFQTLDATGLLDSDYVFTADSLASFLGESMPLDDDEMRA